MDLNHQHTLELPTTFVRGLTKYAAWFSITTAIPLCTRQRATNYAAGLMATEVALPIELLPHKNGEKGSRTLKTVYTVCFASNEVSLPMLNLSLFI